MPIESVNVSEMLDTLRWRADQIITNYEGERVWLKTVERGVTDCCFVDEPCAFHALLTHPAPGKTQ